MYSHSPENTRVDVVDLDPYGTAAPFIDAAVQCVKDGGQSAQFVDCHSLTCICLPHRLVVRNMHRSRGSRFDKLFRKMVSHPLSGIITASQTPTASLTTVASP